MNCDIKDVEAERSVVLPRAGADRLATDAAAIDAHRPHSAAGHSIGLTAPLLECPGGGDVVTDALEPTGRT